MEFQEVENAIREAFKDVIKGGGIGVREAIALDDRATPELQKKAREEDTELHWSDIPEEWQQELGTALSFTDKEGFRFLLPAAMTSGNADSVYFHLCCPHIPQGPHHGHKEYLNYLRSVNPKEIATMYGFTDEQIHAIAVFFKWYMQDTKDYLYADKDKKLLSLQDSFEQQKDLPETQYNLTLEDEVAFFDEECRILRDWLKLGKVQID